jgi:hypothetical protein
VSLLVRGTHVVRACLEGDIGPKCHCERFLQVRRWGVAVLVSGHGRGPGSGCARSSPFRGCRLQVAAVSRGSGTGVSELKSVAVHATEYKHR